MKRLRREGRERALLAYQIGAAAGMRSKMPDLDKWLAAWEPKPVSTPQQDWRAVKAGMTRLIVVQQAVEARRGRVKRPDVVKPRTPRKPQT